MPRRFSLHMYVFRTLRSTDHCCVHIACVLPSCDIRYYALMQFKQFLFRTNVFDNISAFFKYEKTIIYIVSIICIYIFLLYLFTY